MKGIVLALVALLVSTATFGQESSPDWVKVPHKWSMDQMQHAPNPLTDWSRPPTLASTAGIERGYSTGAAPWLPVPWLIVPDDLHKAVEFGASHKNLSGYVQNCYRNVASNAQVGSTDYAREVAFCAEVDVAGLVLDQQDPYFKGAENRIGTELIAFAGLNTYQAVQTINWMKATMAPMVRKATAH